MRPNGRERFSSIHAALNSDSRVRSWYCYAPGDRGRRWVVETREHGTRVYSTREVEIFLGLG